MPGAFSGAKALAFDNFDLPEHYWITGAKANTIEDMMRETRLQHLPLRKQNSLHHVPINMYYLQSTVHRIVETSGSLIERLLSKSIHPVT